MSCNGCRVLRKGCSETCVLRSSLQWIETPEAQGNATLFLAKFFGRSDLLSLIYAVPESQRPALFQSLLYEACGRTVNPVNGAVGLLSSRNWHVCEAAVLTVLNGGALRPLVFDGSHDESSESFCVVDACRVQKVQYPQSTPFMMGNQAASDSNTPKRVGKGRERINAVSFCGAESDMTSFESGTDDGNRERKLLNLFV
ncbi:DUF260 domain-containing protein [Cephalotus follicularis]|uniref:DUF260 domain-containing protein n=1 Tax=Cephalotus follicularis TaxID=3775 RepID=A0A1Q3BRF8_CEPFO|nr:DUF260 domain-containing protein [Cephalotus follicularis]